MYPAVLRLALVGSRSSVGRLIGILGGVAAGVSLLLVWGAGQGMIQREARAVWLDANRTPAVLTTAEVDSPTASEATRPVPLTPESALVDRADEVFRGQLVHRRDVAVTEDSTVRIPGIGAAPAPGTYYASPALQQLIETTPADQLGNRYGDFAGTKLHLADLAVGPVTTTAVVVVVVTASAAVAGWRTARAGIGPLGAARTRTGPTPTAQRALPLAAGLAAMSAAVLLADTVRLGPLAIEVLLVGGFALTTLGIVVIVPWLTLLAARISLARASSAAAVIAAGRIRLTPRATFRSVSGLVIGVFMVSVFAGASSTTTPAGTPPTGPGLLASTSVYALLDSDRAPADVTELAETTQDLAGVRDTAVGYARTTPDHAGPPPAAARSTSPLPTPPLSGSRASRQPRWSPSTPPSSAPGRMSPCP